jgi:hypothetical protein
LIYSSVPGPITPYVITGKKAQRMMFLVGGVGSLAAGLTVFTCYETLKVAFNADISKVDNPKELIDLFN